MFFHNFINKLENEKEMKLRVQVFRSVVLTLVEMFSKFYVQRINRDLMMRSHHNIKERKGFFLCLYNKVIRITLQGK